MQLLSTYHLKRWIEEHKSLFSPPYRTNRLVVQQKDFMLMAERLGFLNTEK